MASPLAGRTLLLVAEDGGFASLLAMAASRLGADVEVVASGRAAIDTLALRQPSVVVLDLPLADVRGGEVFAAFGRAGVPIFAVSGVYRGARAAEEVRRLGAMDFFEKPFAVDALAAAVAHALGVHAPGIIEQARDEVSGSRPLSAEEIPQGISSAPLPALDGAPIAAPVATVAEAVHVTRGEIPPAPRGKLSDATVPRLLVAVHEGRATGALTVRQGPVRKIFAFEGGVAVYAASNVGTERLGAICVRRGIVDERRLEALRHERPDTGTAELLTSAQLIGPQERVELVAGQIRAIVWSTFEWREGEYEFQIGRPPANRVDVRLSMGDVVLEGMNRASTLPRLRAELPGEAHLAPSPDPAFELYALGLRPGEAHLLAAADGTKSVNDLVRLSDMPERDTLAFLQACRVMRVLDEVDRVLASTRRIGFM